ncbi:hypothetical protein KKH43_04315 [Patescibacteria group bacterium]|nr:hypothetical protein [Patescibacteria group bacterium]
MSDLFDETYRLCQEWQCRPFTVKQKFRDFFDEFLEFLEAVVTVKGKKEVGLEYGDVIFTIARHGRGEPIHTWRKLAFNLFPWKFWLKRKLKVFNERHDWWMTHHGFHSIRNYKNPVKRQKIIDRNKYGKNKGVWIK